MWRERNPIDAVIFDYSGVIGMPTWNLAARSWSAEPVSHDEILRAMSHGYDDAEHPWCQWERGELDFDGFRNAMADRATTGSIDWTTLTLAVGDVVPITPIVRAAELATSLGLAVALLSNTMHELTRALDAFDDLFPTQFRSCELGMRKPQSEMFEKALAHLGTTAKRTLFLDDNPICITGAESVGLQTILVEDAGEAAREMLERIGC